MYNYVFIVDNRTVIAPDNIANKSDDYFFNIGQSLFDKIYSVHSCDLFILLQNHTHIRNMVYNIDIQ